MSFSAYVKKHYVPKTLKKTKIMMRDLKLNPPPSWNSEIFIFVQEISNQSWHTKYDSPCVLLNFNIPTQNYQHHNTQPKCNLAHQAHAI